MMMPFRTESPQFLLMLGYALVCTHYLYALDICINLYSSSLFQPLKFQVISPTFVQVFDSSYNSRQVCTFHHLT